MLSGQRVVYRGPMQAELEPFEVDETGLGPTEVVVRTEVTLISPGTELANLQGKLGMHSDAPGDRGALLRSDGAAAVVDGRARPPAPAGRRGDRLGPGARERDRPGAGRRRDRDDRRALGRRREQRSLEPADAAGLLPVPEA